MSFNTPRTLNLLATYTANNSGQAVFTGLGTGYVIYVIKCSGVSIASANDTLKLFFSTDNGANWVTGATNQWCLFSANSANDNGLAGTGSNTDTSCTIAQATTTTASLYGDVYLFNMGVARAPSAMFIGEQINNAGEIEQILSACGDKDINTVNAIKISATTGNLNTGTFTLYGVQAI